MGKQNVNTMTKNNRFLLQNHVEAKFFSFINIVRKLCKSKKKQSPDVGWGGFECPQPILHYAFVQRSDVLHCNKQSISRTTKYSFLLCFVLFCFVSPKQSSCGVNDNKTN